MVRFFAWALGAALLLAPAPSWAAGCGQQERRDKDASTQAPPPPRPKFWVDPGMRKQLGITDQQSRAIDEIFEGTVPSLRTARKDMERLENELSKTVHDNVADIATVSKQIDQVEAARSAYNKARTLMLYRMNLVLSADQRAQVRAMFDRDDAKRREDDRGRSDREPRR